MNILRACFDWRVLSGLAALGVGIYLVAPDLIAAAIPLLLLAVCPLSMLLMTKAMSGQQGSDAMRQRPMTQPCPPAKSGDAAQ